MKKFIELNRVERFNYLVLAPAIIVTCFYIMFGNLMWKDPGGTLKGLVLSFIGAMATWNINLSCIYWAKNKFPELRHSFKRILLALILQMLVFTLAIYMVLHVWEWADVYGYMFTQNSYQWAMTVALAYCLISVATFEANYIYKKYKDSLAEKDWMEKLNTEQEIEVLKNQINPHFLFNCFNTLSSLISEDKTEAEKFLNELSKVYRYLLRNNEMGFSTVETEIRFIESYYSLLKTRYREGFQLSVTIDQQYKKMYIPTLALQLLVENAVKHNIISKQKPLVVEIFTTAGRKLVVNNNLQRKQTQEQSTHIGLKNIKSKYKIMKQDGFQVVEGNRNFMVVLPLMWNPNLQ